VRELSYYCYRPDPVKNKSASQNWMAGHWFGKDEMDNNPLHYAYLSDQPAIRQILRNCGLGDEEFIRRQEEEQDKRKKDRLPPSQVMNMRSKVPSQMRHEQKCEDSADESVEKSGDELDDYASVAREQRMVKIRYIDTALAGSDEKEDLVEEDF